MSAPDGNDFEKAARAQAQTGFIGELWGFLRENKKWRRLPIFIALRLLGALVLLSGTGLAPFIYTLF